MFEKMIQLSLRYAALVLVLAGVLVAYAVWQIPQMPVDVFPELNAPTVVLVSEAGGRVTGMDGTPFDPAAAHLVASNGQIHDAMLDVIKRVPA